MGAIVALVTLGDLQAISPFSFAFVVYTALRRTAQLAIGAPQQGLGHHVRGGAGRASRVAAVSATRTMAECQNAS